MLRSEKQIVCSCQREVVLHREVGGGKVQKGNSVFSAAEGNAFLTLSQSFSDSVFICCSSHLTVLLFCHHVSW